MASVGSPRGGTTAGTRLSVGRTAAWAKAAISDLKRRRASRPGSGRSIVGSPFDNRPLKAGVVEKRRSEEHTSELQSLMRNSYAVFCLNKNKYIIQEEKRTTYIV